MRQLLTGRAEEDTDGRLPEGLADAEVVSRLAHDLLNRAVARVGDNSQHSRRHLIVRCELGLSIGNVSPLRVQEERRRRDVEGIG
jgi:hypothetical protein